MLKEIKKFPRHRIHASSLPSFQAQLNRNRGLFGSSKIDLIVAQVKIHKLALLEGKIAEGSDHFQYAS